MRDAEGAEGRSPEGGPKGEARRTEAIAQPVVARPLDRAEAVEYRGWYGPRGQGGTPR